MRLALIILLTCSTLNAQTVLRSAVIHSWNCGTNSGSGGGGSTTCTNVAQQSEAYYGWENYGSAYQRTNYAITYIVSAGNTNPCSVEVKLTKVGSPTNTVRVGIFSTTNWVPNALISQWSDPTNCASISATVTSYTFTIPTGFTQTVGHTNAIVLHFTDQISPFSSEAYVDVAYGNYVANRYDYGQGYNGSGAWEATGVGQYPGWFIMYKP